ncbi:hypothetical protein, partial [Enterobacter hormaechei]|uniref:hypothetical protein n=1 Tax=Enterobacter hormaechei TaxID=158836 RepID=UPI00203D52A9
MQSPHHLAPALMPPWPLAGAAVAKFNEWVMVIQGCFTGASGGQVSRQFRAALSSVSSMRASPLLRPIFTSVFA